VEDVWKEDIRGTPMFQLCSKLKIDCNLSGARQVRRGDSPSSSEKGCREKAAIESGAKSVVLGPSSGNFLLL